MNDWLINEAMLFCAKFFIDSCHNHGKPVYLHSLRIAHQLYELGYEDKIIVGAILHDLLEDTDCNKTDIAEKFGQDVADLVDCLSFNPTIPDKLERSKLSIDACIDYGKDALVIKCVDAADNSNFFEYASEEDKVYLREKYKYLFQICETYIPEESAFGFYQKAVEKYIF